MGAARYGYSRAHSCNRGLHIPLYAHFAKKQSLHGTGLAVNEVHQLLFIGDDNAVGVFLRFRFHGNQAVFQADEALPVGKLKFIQPVVILELFLGGKGQLR